MPWAVYLWIRDEPKMDHDQRKISFIPSSKAIHMLQAGCYLGSGISCHPACRWTSEMEAASPACIKHGPNLRGEVVPSLDQT
jgi:hypothetical protein